MIEMFVLEHNINLEFRDNVLAQYQLPNSIKLGRRLIVILKMSPSQRIVCIETNCTKYSSVISLFLD